MVPTSLVSHYCSFNLEALNTLTGASLPLFSTMHRLAALVRQQRGRRGKGWSDQNLLDGMQRAMELEKDLTNEKKRLDALLLGTFSNFLPISLISDFWKCSQTTCQAPWLLARSIPNDMSHPTPPRRPLRTPFIPAHSPPRPAVPFIA